VKTYRVERRTEGREVYLVDADSPEEAEAKWFEGDLLASEVLSSEAYSVEVDDA
jgi:hypothetical protein